MSPTRMPPSAGSTSSPHPRTQVIPGDAHGVQASPVVHGRVDLKVAIAHTGQKRKLPPVPGEPVNLREQLHPNPLLTQAGARSPAHGLRARRQIRRVTVAIVASSRRGGRVLARPVSIEFAGPTPGVPTARYKAGRGGGPSSSPAGRLIFLPLAEAPGALHRHCTPAFVARLHLAARLLGGRTIAKAELGHLSQLR